MSGGAELGEREQLQARAIAGLVLGELRPGCGPMLLPEWAVEVLADIGQNGAYRLVHPVYLGGAHTCMLQTAVLPGGSLQLVLELDGNPRVWEGVLRGPGRGA